MYNEPTSLIAKKGSGLKPTAASLKGKTVGVESGTIQETYAKTYWQPNGVNVFPIPARIRFMPICSPAVWMPRCRIPWRPITAF